MKTFGTFSYKTQNYMTAFNRRSFVSRIGAFSAAGLLSTLTQPAWSRNLEKAIQQAGNIPPDQLASDEDFWYYIQQSLPHLLLLSI